MRRPQLQTRSPSADRRSVAQRARRAREALSRVSPVVAAPLASSALGSESTILPNLPSLQLLRFPSATSIPSTSGVVRSRSLFSKPDMISTERKEPLTSPRSSHSRIPSSPPSCYSLPTSFEKFSNGIKQQSNIKSSGKSTTGLGMVIKAISALKVSTTGKKVSSGKPLGSSDHGFESGPKAFRRSWEGGMEIKGSETSSMRVTKQDLKPETRSTSVPRRKLALRDTHPSKDENKGQISAKEVTANGPNQLSNGLLLERELQKLSVVDSPATWSR